jgi:hypothetical protein
MSDEACGFAPPPFKPEAAMEQLGRALRDLKLSARGNGFELRGRRVLELQPEATQITVRVARRLALTPEWDTLTLKSTPDQRKLIDDIKKRLDRWDREE